MQVRPARRSAGVFACAAPVAGAPQTCRSAHACALADGGRVYARVKWRNAHASGRSVRMRAFAGRAVRRLTAVSASDGDRTSRGQTTDSRSRGQTAAVCVRAGRGAHAPAEAQSVNSTRSPLGHHRPHERRTRLGRIRTANLQGAAHTRGLHARVQYSGADVERRFPNAGGRSGESGAAGRSQWGVKWDLGCMVGESGVEWAVRMVMHRGTRVAGLLPPSHPGSDFAYPHENP